MSIRTPTAGSADVLMMLLADARLPSGGHTQSAGLEPAMLAGLPVAAVPDYIAARLATAIAVEAGTAIAARAACGDSDVTAGLTAVDRAWRVRVPSAALRSASIQLGRGHARLVGSLWPGPTSDALMACGPVGRSVAVGVAAFLAGLSAERTARLVAYDDVQTVAAAALKLHPMDPAEATAWVLRSGPAIDRLAAGLVDVSSPDDIPASGAPHIEAWAEIHAVTQQRLFRA